MKLNDANLRAETPGLLRAPLFRQNNTAFPLISSGAKSRCAVSRKDLEALHPAGNRNVSAFQLYFTF